MTVGVGEVGVGVTSVGVAVTVGSVVGVTVGVSVGVEVGVAVGVVSVGVAVGVSVTSGVTVGVSVAPLLLVCPFVILARAAIAPVPSGSLPNVIFSPGSSAYSYWSTILPSWSNNTKWSPPLFRTELNSM